MTTSIEWTRNADGSAGRTWNPTTGCDQVSPGCDHCYALTMAKRLKGMGSAKYQNDGDPGTSGPGFAATAHIDSLDEPKRWRKPTRVFVNSMSDLFHDDIPERFIIGVFAVMAQCPQHTFQILTKRHARMRSMLTRWAAEVPWLTEPLPNVWLGVSAEDQKWAEIRIPALLETPAAVRFLSAEPLLGPIDLHGPLVDGHRPNLTYWLTGEPHFGTDSVLAIGPKLDWVIAGGESGPGARPMHPAWVRSLRDQCEDSGTAFFFKQWGEWTPIDATGSCMAEPQNWVSEASGRVVTEDEAMADGGSFTGVWKVGKKAAGRVLDGQTWDEFPA